MKYIVFCVLLCITFATASFFEFRERGRLYKEAKTQSIKIDSLTHAYYSLHDEWFMESTIRTRYEIALEYLKEENPKAGNQFEYILSTRTE
jgi:hypothetical protein